MIFMIMIVNENGFYVPQQPNGANEYVLPSELEEVIDDLIYYCEFYTDEEVDAVNKSRRQSFENYIKSLNVQNKQEKQTKNKKHGYVYVLKCADKYKIGYSKDVERRIKQLDTRPFKLELMFKCYSDRAYDIEQTLHEALTDYKAEGEWYNDTIESIDLKGLIEEVAEDLKCDIQF